MTAREMADRSINAIEEAKWVGDIANPVNLANNSVYILSGTEDDTTLPGQQEAMKLVYEHYGVTNLHYVSENMGHYPGEDKMIPALKQIYVDLGYAKDMQDFWDSENWNEKGDWLDFDQHEFVGIDSGLGW